MTKARSWRVALPRAKIKRRGNSAALPVLPRTGRSCCSAHFAFPGTRARPWTQLPPVCPLEPRPVCGRPLHQSPGGRPARRERAAEQGQCPRSAAVLGRSNAAGRATRGNTSPLGKSGRLPHKPIHCSSQRESANAPRTQGYQSLLTPAATGRGRTPLRHRLAFKAARAPRRSAHTLGHSRVVKLAA
jgi:hypothetical protein